MGWSHADGYCAVGSKLMELKTKRVVERTMAPTRQKLKMLLEAQEWSLKRKDTT